jgi:hypothetical protein
VQIDWSARGRGFPVRFWLWHDQGYHYHHDHLGTGVIAMNARKVRRWLVAVLAAAAVAAGIFASTAQSSADDMDWHAPMNNTVVR